MDWLNSSLKAAQQVAQQALSSEAAEKAKALAQQASRQAVAFAQEASIKAQEVAKEAISEAEKGLEAIKAVAQAPTGSGGAAVPTTDPSAVGITTDLRQFVASLTYATFSDFPLETLPSPEEAGNAPGRLSPWQEAHARAILSAVPSLGDLRFVLCPRRLDEYQFWMVYFSLCRRYLPKAAFEADAGPTINSQNAVAAAAVGSAAAAAAAGGLAAGSSSPLRGGTADAGGVNDSRQGSKPDLSAVAAATGSHDGLVGEVSGSDGVDALADLEADPELEAYLQEALAVGSDGDGGGGAEGEGAEGSDDLDDYINQLDAEVNGR